MVQRSNPGQFWHLIRGRFVRSASHVTQEKLGGVRGRVIARALLGGGGIWLGIGAGPGVGAGGGTLPDGNAPGMCCCCW